jgi:hypothetical protein
LEKVKKYSVLKLGNKLSRSNNNEQAERIVINRGELEIRGLVVYFVHHSITIPQKNALPNNDAEKNIGKEPTTLEFTMCPKKYRVHDLHSIRDLKKASKK